VQNANVDLSLYEGSYRFARHTARTDEAGMALVRMPIPESDDPSDAWQLTAFAESNGETVSASETLQPRDETPGRPTFGARFDDAEVRAGANAPFTISLRDASGVPVAGASVRYWVGQNGLTAPTDTTEAWDKASTPITTNLRGEAHASVAAPKVVAPNGTTQLHLVVRGELEGQKLEHDVSIPVARSAAEASLSPVEAPSVVPGLEQHVSLEVHDGKFEPIVGTFDVEGDGLRASVTTDAHGEAEITWRAPEGLGAFRDTGPCAGGVAAAVRVRAKTPIAGHPEPFTVCVPIDRDARALVMPDKRVVRVGDSVAVRVLGRGVRGPWSVALLHDGMASTTAWIEDGARGGSIAVPTGAPGLYELGVAAPRNHDASVRAQTQILVLPRSIPHLDAKVVTGRITPGGTAEIDATLTDETGKPLMGTIAATLVDLEGGGSVDGVVALDTRVHLCGLASAGGRCDELLSGEPANEPLRRALLGPRGNDLAPILDPGASVDSEWTAMFSSVIHSLEGAVYTSSGDPNRLIDVRRANPNGSFSFNPELLTLTTAAMQTPPLTPGGEPIALADLAAADPQVTFDNVARRVTRYKLFKVLQAVRAFKIAHALDNAEPVLRDPNALVRRLVRSGELNQGMLLDPWGGTMQFVKSAATPIPFINTIPGFELRAPGPNGRIGDGDDVRDPFERVVKSGSPYAKAMSEDEVVDAKLDMQVADTTVSAWSTLLDSATGTALGDGVSGYGEGGGGTGMGSGYGAGHGRLGGRSVHALTNGDAFFQLPQRTDANGHVRIVVPLGDIETTWGLGILALPDHGPPAATKVELVASQPVSLSANAGFVWTAGDEMDVHVIVRNRTNAPVEAKVIVGAEGVAQLAPKPTSVHVEAQSLASFPVRVRAARPGEAVLTAKLDASGQNDAMRFSWNVLAAGEHVTRAASQWVEGVADVKLDVDRRDTVVGNARLVLSRGPADSLAGALDAVNPDRMRAPDAFADAMETASRILRSGPPELRDQARTVLRRASERTRATVVDSHGSPSAHAWLLARRFRAFAPADVIGDTSLFKASEDRACPPEITSLSEEVEALAVLPPGREAELPCWETLAATAINHVLASQDPSTIARAILPIADRTDRATDVKNLVTQLRTLVHLHTSGRISFEHGTRADRTIVYAALLRANKVPGSGVSDDRLAAWIAVDRDASGSFGSVAASRAVAHVLTAIGMGAGAPQNIVVDDGTTIRRVVLGSSGVLYLGLGPSTTKVTVRADGGVVARLERPMIRGFSNPPDESDSPLRLDVKWPDGARAGHIATLHVTMSSLARESVHAVARIPLPPGASMVAPLADVTQVHGALLVAADLGASRTFDVPIRFSLAGRAIARESQIVAPRASYARNIALAQTLVVK
jgi:hypothetical protein